MLDKQSAWLSRTLSNGGGADSSTTGLKYDLGKVPIRPSGVIPIMKPGFPGACK